MFALLTVGMQRFISDFDLGIGAAAGTCQISTAQFSAKAMKET